MSSQTIIPVPPQVRDREEVPAVERLGVALLHDDSLAMRGAISAIQDASDLFFTRSFNAADDITDYLAERPAETDVLVVTVPRQPAPGFFDSVGEWTRSTKVLAVSPATDPDRLASLVEAGVHGYLDADTECATLFAALNTVAKGNFFMSGRAVRDVLRKQATPASEPYTDGVPDALTVRERQVLALVADGWTHKQIGTRLYLSKATVDTYVQRIRQKLGLRNKAELTRAAMGFGIRPAADIGGPRNPGAIAG
jgi:DNA-binding NarL/FixJ family response regulator